MSVTINEAPRGSTITVVVKINATIPSNTQFLVAGTADYYTASAFDSDIDATHAASLPNLDEDVPESPTLLDFYILRDILSNEVKVLATAWIESIEVVDSKNYTLSLNSITSDEYAGLIKILNNYGLKGRFQLVAN